MSAKSITGYRTVTWKIGTALDGVPGDTFQSVTDHQHQWQVSQEFQLLGKAFDDKLNWVTGLYYFNEGGYVHDYVPFEGLLYVYDVQNDVDNKDIAAFVHADYKVTKQISFTAGARYTDVVADFIGGQERIRTFVPVRLPVLAEFLRGGAPPLRPDHPQCFCARNPVLPVLPEHARTARRGTCSIRTLSAQYHFNDDVMAYASWGKGFKQGGWTTRLSAGITTPVAARFSPEYSKTYELGLKSQWFGSPFAGQCGPVLHQLRRHSAQHPARHFTGVHQCR